MAWFRKTKKADAASERKADLWVQCPSCRAYVYKEEWQKAIQVCPKCNFHGRLTARERIDLLLDTGTFSPRDVETSTADPLHFRDNTGTFATKVAETEEKTGLKEAVLSGRGKVNGIEVTLVVMDFRFLGGSLGSGTGEIIYRASLRALRHRHPLVIVSASGGARMQEGMYSLMQMAKTCAGIARLDQAGVPYISILTHPTMGGVSASFAMVGDVNLAEPGALIGFAGRRVIEQTIKQKLPEGFQSAEYLLEHGFIDLIVPRRDLKERLAGILRYGTPKTLGLGRRR